MQHTVTDHRRRPGVGALLVVVAALLWGTAGLRCSRYRGRSAAASIQAAAPNRGFSSVGRTRHGSVSRRW
jgi:F0F1-type ATP synthase membrane subunit c/vacuolar-type H+-ATPase subunit K